MEQSAAGGRAAPLRLVSGAHAVLESSGPGHLESLRLGFDDFAAGAIEVPAEGGTPGA
jgi:hypothetical protein